MRSAFLRFFTEVKIFMTSFSVMQRDVIIPVWTKMGFYFSERASPQPLAPVFESSPGKQSNGTIDRNHWTGQPLRYAGDRNRLYRVGWRESENLNLNYLNIPVKRFSWYLMFEWLQDSSFINLFCLQSFNSTVLQKA